MGIRFSDTILKLTIDNIPMDTEDEWLWTDAWEKLIRDPYSRIPLDWVAVPNDRYIMDQYPSRGFFSDKVILNRYKVTPQKAKTTVKRNTVADTDVADIAFNKNGSIDIFHLRYRYKQEKKAPPMGFSDWLEFTGIAQFAKDKQVKIAQTDIIPPAKMSKHLRFYIDRYEASCRKVLTTFEFWYMSEGIDLPLPDETQSQASTGTNGPAPSTSARSPTPATDKPDNKKKSKPISIKASEPDTDSQQQTEQQDQQNQTDREESEEGSNPDEDHANEEESEDSTQSPDQKKSFRKAIPSAAARINNLHKEATAYMSSLAEDTRKSLQKTFDKWKKSYPKEHFKKWALRNNPQILSEHIYENDSEAEQSLNFLQLDETPETTQDWRDMFEKHCVQLPPTEHPLLTPEKALMGNLVDTLPIETLDSITAKDFLEDGRFGHIYIGRQFHVPEEIFKILQINPSNFKDTLMVLWRRLYAARVEAAHLSEFLLPQKHWTMSPWLELLSDTNVSKTFDHDYVDVSQYYTAHRHFRLHTLQTAPFETLYNNFVRPLERLFTTDMPLNAKLQDAVLSKDATDDLAKYVCTLIGWDELPYHMQATALVEELSRIRAVPSGYLIRKTTIDQPTLLASRMDCRHTKYNSYRGVSIRQEMKKRGIKVPKMFQTESKQKLDKRLTETLQQIEEEQVELQEIYKEIRRVGTRKSYSLDPISQQKIAEEEGRLQEEVGRVKTSITKKWKDFRHQWDQRTVQDYELPPLDQDVKDSIDEKMTRDLVSMGRSLHQENRTLYYDARYLRHTFIHSLKETFDFYSTHELKVRRQEFKKIVDMEMKYAGCYQQIDYIELILLSRDYPTDFAKDFKKVDLTLSGRLSQRIATFRQNYQSGGPPPPPPKPIPAPRSSPPTTSTSTSTTTTASSPPTMTPWTTTTTISYQTRQPKDTKTAPKSSGILRRPVLSHNPDLPEATMFVNNQTDTNRPSQRVITPANVMTSSINSNKLLTTTSGSGEQQQQQHQHQ